MNVLPSVLHFQFCDPQSPGPKFTYWRTVYYINSGLEFDISSVYYLFLDLGKLAFPCLFSWIFKKCTKKKSTGIFLPENNLQFLSQEI